MYSFFILGIIPGTNITITFSMWLTFAIFLTALVAFRYFVYSPAPITDDWQPNSVLLPLSVYI